MADHKALAPIDATLLQKYAPTIASGAVLLLGGLQVLMSSGHTLVDILQFITLVLTTLTTFQFTGWWKTALESAGVVVVAVLPFAIDHTVTWANVLLIVIAVVKALSAHFGIIVRADSAPIDAGSTSTPGTPAATNVR